MATTANSRPLATTHPGRLASLSGPLVVGVGVAAATTALHFRDPHVRGSWGFCPTALLGFDCPACGTLRAVHDLTNLDLAGAASSNLVFVLLVPVIVTLWMRRIFVLWRFGPGSNAASPLTVPRPVWVLSLVVIALFTLVRNLPIGLWLHS